MPVLSTPQASVVIEVTPGTATIPEDFIGANLTSPPPGLVTPITFNIDVVSDDLFETDETFEIRASSTSGISGSPVSIIISNDDSPPALVAPVLVEVFEGDIPGGGGATAVFPVKLSNISGVDLVLRYSTADGSAVAPLDYTAIPVSMTTFAAGTSDKNVTVALTGGNRIQEPDKSFVVQLALFHGATQVSSANVTINIKNDDWLYAQISPTIQSVNEGTPGQATTATSDIVLTAQPTANVTVNFSTRDITATADADYTATSGSLTFTPVNWGVPQQVTVGILPDVLLEADEMFAIDISVAAPFTSIVNASTSSSTVTIRNKLVQGPKCR
ncbi:hemagglutinin [Monoraphidium neglectum]|uniref:Hemagglutinin n=1 Tax=Monoraphidium neglectum TaxID=145388 RepID=A0A0D2MFJ1_9CHLO|nr:hemagglutinin [Monoraphidium neglectum]KIZ01905.1 hemagglutinin [Monoraphidium neglectum]|eukprot:XP_013900924.1 hemagglutinin [Monoraphidium neglectum]